jgi:hypothetical protein
MSQNEVVLKVDGMVFVFATKQHFEHAVVCGAAGSLSHLQMADRVYNQQTGQYIKHRGFGAEAANAILNEARTFDTI